MHVIITGSRKIVGFDSQSFISNVLATAPFPIESITHGGAVGADVRAARYAAMLDIPQLRFPCTTKDWKVWGRGAGHRRNRIMVNETIKRFGVENVIVLAFYLDAKLPDGTPDPDENRGTRGCANYALSKGLTVHYFGWTRPSIPKD